MLKQRVSTWIPKLATAASVIAASTLIAGFIAPSASAFSLVPQREGEVNVGLGTSLDANGYLTLNPIINSVESLVDSSTGTKSRLFVDKAGTANTYGAVNFLKFDIGTADLQQSYWFRPVAVNAGGTLPENGQLEVGTFLFKFAQAIESLKVSWFDTEYRNGTSYSVNNGEFVSVPAGANRNIYTASLTNVSELLLNIGEKGSGILVNGERSYKIGDGVLVTAEAVPEPGTVGALIGVGVLGLMARRRKGAVS